MLRVPVPEDVLAVIVVVPCPSNTAVPVDVSVKVMTAVLLELQVADTADPFTSAEKSIVPTPAPPSADKL